MNSYVALIGLMIFAFGLGFLLPVLVVFLQLVGVVTPRRVDAELATTRWSASRCSPP